MGVFGALKNAVTSPFRAIGDLARLKIRKAVGDITDGAKVSLPIALAATGVGAPLALGLGAAEGAADSWGHGQNNIGKIALGAGAGAATALAANAAGGAFRGGVRVPGAGDITGGLPDADAAIASADNAASIAGGADLSSLPDVASSVAPISESVVPNVAPPGVSNVLNQTKGGGFLKGQPFKAIGALAKKKPEIVAQAIGTGLQTFTGVNTDNRKLDIQAQQVENERQDNERRAKLAELTAMLQGYASFRPQYRPIGG